MNELLESLVDAIPLDEGDKLLVSSDVKSIALVLARQGERFSPSDLIDLLQQRVGGTGTLLFPTYNWDFCKGVPFVLDSTRGKTGTLGNAALTLPGFSRTRHPLYSLAVWGADRDRLCASRNMDSFGPESVFAYLRNVGAKNLCINVSAAHCMTFIHHVEQMNPYFAPYRFIKAFTAPYVDEGGERTETATMFVRDFARHSAFKEDELQHFLRESDASLASKCIDGTQIDVFDLARVYNLIEHDLRYNASRSYLAYDGQEEVAERLPELRQQVAALEAGGAPMMGGEEMHALATRLFPICRSLTGDGVRETLMVLHELNPDIVVHEVPSGTEVFDWTVPDEWNIEDAYIEDEAGHRIVSFADTNLHIMGYSEPVDAWMERDELLEHVYVQEDRPDAIPYVTSYYKRRWGFCMSKRNRDSLPEGRYHAVIRSTLAPGSLTYGELLVPATVDEPEGEILFSTYDCHPSMANNELSGPCVWTALALYVKGLATRRYSYRFVIVPETIGSITYLSRNLDHLKKSVRAGFNLSCVGDERAYSYVASRYGDTLADRVATNVLHFTDSHYLSYSFLNRGSDERQYNAPGVDLPVCAICRSKYGEYPEYHTSDDDLSLVTPAGLEGGALAFRRCIDALEANFRWRVTCLCEPQLGKRGLYPTVSKKGSYGDVRAMTDFIAYADGTNDLIAISNLINVPTWELIPIARRLKEAGLIEVVGFGADENNIAAGKRLANGMQK